MSKRHALSLTFAWVESQGYYYGYMRLDEATPNESRDVIPEAIEKYEFRLDPAQVDSEQMPDDITRDILVALIAQI